jgi:ribonuclease HI
VGEDPPLPTPIAERLCHALASWAEIGADQLIREGIRAEWSDLEAPSRLTHSFHITDFFFRGTIQDAYRALLQEELDEGVVRKVEGKHALWLNPTFLVPKRGNKWRKVLDCRRLNEELRDVHFAMEGVEVAQALVRQGDWGTSLDFKSAFNHVPVNADLQPYLCFRFLGKTYQYCGMPFGVKHAPRVFTKIMKKAITAVRTRWNVRMTFYMDDTMLLFEEREKAVRETVEIAAYLEQLGWTLSREKCQFEPTQDIEFLGWRWNLMDYNLRMGTDRQRELLVELRDWIQAAEQRGSRPVRSLASLIGRLNFLRTQIPEASLHLRRMDRLKAEAVARGGWTSACTITPLLLGELKWWARVVHDNTPHSLQARPVVATITTDASPWGWGAVLTQDRVEKFSFGTWRRSQCSFTSNAKEMTAVRLGLLHFAADLESCRGATVLVQSDNSTTVADINALRAAATLVPHMLLLLRAVKRMEVSLTAVHLPGVQNQAADRLSRLGLDREYHLRAEVREHLMAELQFKPNIDVFNAGTPSPREWGMRTLKDGLRVPWTGYDLYLHPPLNLLMGTLLKLRAEPARAILIYPAWGSQPWTHLLREMECRSIDLGSFDEAMEVTERFKQQSWKLPPGNVRGGIVDTRTMRGSCCSNNC